MTCTEKWNLIVEKHQQLYSSLEARIQAEWEMYCSELFGYRNLFGEIDAQRHLAVGAGNAIIPDIILRVDEKDIFDIELKQYSLPFDQQFENQLISYLNQTHLSVGMIVCQKIYLYYYDYTPNNICKIEIPFEKDHPDGIALMDMLTKEAFSAEKIREYILQKEELAERIREIKSKITSNWVKETVRTKLAEEYPEIDIDRIVNGFSFHVTEQAVAPIQVAPPPARRQTTAPNHPNDISHLIREWCDQKDHEGRLIFQRDHSNNSYTRFTTQDLSEILPYQDGVRSGWNCGHFYLYEARGHQGKLRMHLTVSNKNAPEFIRHQFARVRQAVGRPFDGTDWQWCYIFSATAYPYNDQTSPEDIHNALNAQFEEIRRKVEHLLSLLQTV